MPTPPRRAHPTAVYREAAQRLRARPDVNRDAQLRCLEMLSDFPELSVQRGRAPLPDLEGPQPHWWLLDAGGEIIDPSGPTAWAVDHWTDYEPEMDEEDRDPVGTCLACGFPIGEHRHFCSSLCQREYIEWLDRTVLA